MKTNIYIRPSGLERVEVASGYALDFTAAWMRPYNAILVADSLSSQEIEIWPRIVDENEKKDLGSGSVGFLGIPSCLGKRLKDVLKSKGFKEFQPEYG